MNPVYGSLLRQMMYTEHARAALWVSGALLCGALALLLGFGTVVGNWRLGVLLFDILSGSVVLLWWAGLLRISLLQATPANARLVPRLLARRSAE